MVKPFWSDEELHMLRTLFSQGLSDLQKALEMYATGFSRQIIASHLGRTPMNLAWSTYQRNSADRWEHDTMIGFRGAGEGARHFGISSKAERSSLAAILRVSESTIYAVQAGKTWAEPSSRAVVKHHRDGGFTVLRSVA